MGIGIELIRLSRAIVVMFLAIRILVTPGYLGSSKDREILPNISHAQEITSLAFSPDGTSPRLGQR